MDFDEASNILKGEQVEVDSSVFAASPQPSGVWIRCDVRFLENTYRGNRGGTGGWADISGDRLYVIPAPPHHGSGIYVPLALVRKAPADKG